MDFNKRDNLSYGLVDQGIVKEMAVTRSGSTIITAHSIDTGMQIIPGIAPAVAYAAGDALGTLLVIGVPKVGLIETVAVSDWDAETTSFHILLFNGPITSGVDNGAFDLGDADSRQYIGHITVNNADFISLADNSVAVVPNVSLMYHAPEGQLYIQLVTRGAQNYTTANDLAIRFVITEYH